MNLLNKLLCFLGLHDWTSRFIEGDEIPALTYSEQHRIDAYNENIKIYCKHCGDKIDLITPFKLR